MERMEKITTGDLLRARLDELTPSLKMEKTLENFDNIELTQSEAVEALRRGREEKYYELKRIEYNAKLKAERAFRTFDAGQLFSFFETTFEVDDSNKEIVKQM